MGSVYDRSNFKKARENYKLACEEFLKFHSDNAQEIWQWKKTGDGDPDVIALYIEHSKAVDVWKREVIIASRNCKPQKKEKPVIV